MIPINTNYKKNYYPDEKSGICVVRRDGESVEDLLKRFRKKFSKSGVIKEVRDRMYYEKPSFKRRRKKMQSIRLISKEVKEREQLEEILEKNKTQNIRRKRKDSYNDTSNK